MSFHEEISDENPLSSNELFDLIISDSLTEITNKINSDHLITPDYLEELLTTENKWNQTAINLSIILGRLDIFKLLLSKSTKLNETNKFGYSSVHFAVAWRRLEELKLLYESGYDILLKTTKNEKPLLMATRYNYDDIRDFLMWANARDLLLNYINDTRNLLSSVDKSRVMKEDKKLCESVFTDCDSWMKSNPDASTNEFHDKLEECRQSLECIWNKFGENHEES